MNDTWHFSTIERLSSFRGKMYCHYIGWCIGKCPLYRGVLYSECPLSDFGCKLRNTCTCIAVLLSVQVTLFFFSVPLTIFMHSAVYSVLWS